MKFCPHNLPEVVDEIDLFMLFECTLLDEWLDLTLNPIEWAEFARFPPWFESSVDPVHTMLPCNTNLSRQERNSEWNISQN